VSRFVLHASVALAWVVDEKPDPYAERVQTVLREGMRAVVPVLWQLEVASVLAMVQRRKVLSGEATEEALRYLESFVVTLAEVDGYVPGIRQAFSLAQDLQLTAYDAVYIELAQRQGLPLATLDKSLRAAATKAGVGAL
jgi:predicted nucleic acid-binding protein